MYKDCDHELEVFDSDNCPLCRIKQLEDRCDKLCKNIDGKNERLGALTSEIGQLESDRKEVFDLSHTIALANIDDRLVDPINRIAKLSKDLEGKE